MQIAVAVISFLIIYYILDRIYIKNWDKNLDVEVKFSTTSAFEGEKINLLETLTNRKWLPLPWVTLKFRMSRSLQFMDESLEAGTAAISDGYYRNDIFSVVMFQRIVRTIPCICKKRGFYSVSKLDIISSNAFVSTKFVGHLPCNAAISVYPKIIDVEQISVPLQRLSGSIIANSHVYPDPFEFRGIREYQPFDPLKNINFKASAKTGVLMSNVYDNTVSQEVVIILNVQKYLIWASDFVFEHSIRIAASVAANFITEGVPVAFRTNGKDIQTGEEITVRSGSGSGHLNSIYESMARISYENRIKPITNILDEIMYDKHKNPVFVIISPYCGDDLKETFSELCQDSFDSLWIIPLLNSEAEALKVDSITTHNIVKWEVNYDVI